MGLPILSGIVDAVTGVQKYFDAGKAEKRARKNQEEIKAAIEGQDWEPEYATAHIKNPKTGDASYTRADAPSARAYLESFLGGYNPQTATFSADPRHAEMTRVATNRYNRAFGGYDAKGNPLSGQRTIARRERELDRKPIFTATPITRPVQDKSPEATEARGGGGFAEMSQKDVYIMSTPAGKEKGARMEQAWPQYLKEHAQHAGVDVNDNVAMTAWYKKNRDALMDRFAEDWYYS